MNIAKKNLKGFSYFGAFVIVFIVILFVVDCPLLLTVSSIVASAPIGKVTSKVSS